MPASSTNQRDMLSQELRAVFWTKCDLSLFARARGFKAPKRYYVFSKRGHERFLIPSSSSGATAVLYGRSLITKNLCGANRQSENFNWLMLGQKGVQLYCSLLSPAWSRERELRYQVCWRKKVLEILVPKQSKTDADRTKIIIDRLNTSLTKPLGKRTKQAIARWVAIWCFWD
jgi:hypothetical protein